jgi:aspartyl-tRNA(Asn)/glutamyl-tRNA(Gln) amidotransferase subunit C
MADDRRQSIQRVSEHDVVHVADLANLELTQEERGRMVNDLNSILDYVAILNELDTSNVEPMAQTSDRFGIDESKTGTARFAYAMREDKSGPSLARDMVMENAPEGDREFFKVPKVIEK